MFSIGKLVLLICTALLSKPAYGQIYNETSDRPLSLYILADATFNAKAMPVPFSIAYTVSGDGTVTSNSIQDRAIQDAYISYLTKNGIAVGTAMNFARLIVWLHFFKLMPFSLNIIQSFRMP